MENSFDLQVGDRITFTNKLGYKVDITVTRVGLKSWWAEGRNSYGTLRRYSKYSDFAIIRNKG